MSERYVARLLAGLDAYPAYYAHMGPANAAGAGRARPDPAAPADAGELRAPDRGGRMGGGPARPQGLRRRHLAGTFSFGLDGPMSTYLGWLIPWGRPVTLLGESPEEVAGPSGSWPGSASTARPPRPPARRSSWQAAMRPGWVS